MLTKTLRFLITALLLAAALWVGKRAWEHYMDTPWTRDGRIKADVITISADVAGTVTALLVRDNQLVQKGEVLFVVDQERYANALAQAETVLALHSVTQNQRSKEAHRRASLDAGVVSTENRETADFAVGAAAAQYRGALESVKLARLNLERTSVRAAVSGYVTNLNVHVGDFAAVGAPKLAVIDSASYYVIGYFEETKLPLMREGDSVELRLMSGDTRMRGHVESIARGITDRDAVTGRELLADVNPTFNWVRLAQRVPVRIHIDAMPQGLVLVAGTTCTVVITGGALVAKAPLPAPASAPVQPVIPLKAAKPA